MHRRVWKKVEAKAGKTRMAEVEETRRRETRREGERRKKEEEIKKIKIMKIKKVAKEQKIWDEEEEEGEYRSWFQNNSISRSKFLEKKQVRGW